MYSNCRDVELRVDVVRVRHFAKALH